jgi:transglutaminase-like putative cysteine protease
MRLSIHALLDYTIHNEADVLLQVEAAHDAPDQTVIEGRLTVSTGSELYPFHVEEGFGRRTWTRGAGHFRADYHAVVEVERQAHDIAGLPQHSYHDLPPEAVPFIWPSRYCQSDRFEGFVAKVFGDRQGGDKILAMADYVRAKLDYVPGASTVTTSAVDTFIARAGICRDYAHLLISFARAGGIPARMMSAYALNLEPQDFHAVVEVWLGGAWHIVDPSRLAPIEGLVPIIVGRDATDIAFMTIFGRADLNDQRVTVERLD